MPWRPTPGDSTVRRWRWLPRLSLAHRYHVAVDYEDKVSSAQSCCMCGREFTPEEQYLSALFEEGEVFQRQDFCADCWQGPPAGSFSHWRGRVPAAEEDPKRFVDTGELLQLFVRLEGVTEPRQSAFRYLLGLLLVRKRLLKPLTGRERQGRTLMVTEPGGETTYEVPVPRLSAAELAEVSAQMGAVLRVD